VGVHAWEAVAEWVCQEHERRPHERPLMVGARDSESMRAAWGRPICEREMKEGRPAAGCRS
jgi:hypothetical protein